MKRKWLFIIMSGVLCFTLSAGGFMACADDSQNLDVENSRISQTVDDENADLPFHDVQDTVWYANSVKYVYENDMMNGVADDCFAPDTALSRAMLVTIMYRACGEPPADATSFLTDVKSDAWYAPAVSWAVEKNIVEGFDDQTFRPDEPITREQMAAVFYRFDKPASAPASAPGAFKDHNSVSAWARNAMDWAVQTGLLQGTEQMLMPQGETTRAQGATVIMRYKEKKNASVFANDGDGKSIAVNPENIKKIRIGDGNTGRTVLLEDRQTIESVVSTLSSINYTKHESTQPSTGFVYMIELYANNQDMAVANVRLSEDVSYILTANTKWISEESSNDAVKELFDLLVPYLAGNNDDSDLFVQGNEGGNQMVFNLDSEKVGKIQIGNGNTGKTVTVEDRQRIDRIINSLKEIRYTESQETYPSTGFMYLMEIYAEDGDTVLANVVMGEDSNSIRTANRIWLMDEPSGEVVNELLEMINGVL